MDNGTQSLPLFQENRIVNGNRSIVGLVDSGLVDHLGYLSLKGGEVV